MAVITAAQLDAVLNSEGQGRQINVTRMEHINATLSEVYAVGVTAPYAGRSRWVVITTTDSAATSAAAIQAALTE